MKRIMLACALAICGLSAVANQLTWDPNGTGGWADASRYAQRTAPQEGDRVNIMGGPSCTVTVSRAEFAFVNSLNEVVLYNESTLVFDLEAADDPYALDHVQLHGQAAAHNGGGLVIKKGAGALVYGSTGSKATSSLPCPCKGWRIENGTLKMMGNGGPFEVLSPGRLLVRDGVGDDFTCYGLKGDGVVENEGSVSRQFVFAGGSSGQPFVFAGTFSGPLSPTLRGGYQHLTNPNAFAGSPDIRIWGSEIGVEKFGSTGDPGTLGGSGIFWVRGNPTRVVYLGDGESSDRQFRYNSDSGEITIDAGAHGGLNLTGSVRRGDDTRHLCELVLDGSNVVESVFGCSFSEDGFSTHLAKRGTGTWKLGANSWGRRGAMAVENGIVRYETIAEAGSACVLGLSDMLYEPYSGTATDDRRVEYAFKLGDGSAFAPGMNLPTNSATLSYCGDSAANCSTRPVALAGAGRVRNETEHPLLLSGVTSFGNGDNALVLDSVGANDIVRNVTNGAGRITIVKEGAGTWMVDGDKDFSGVEVRAGTLKLKAQNTYRYFRFTAKDCVDSRFFQLGLFCFWDADGNLLSENLSYHDCVVNGSGVASKLLPGEVTDLHTFSRSGLCSLNPRGIRGVENMFTNVEWSVRKSKDVIWSGDAGKTVSLDDSTSWQGFICRLPEGSPVARYDMMPTSYGTREPISWTLEGSMDGNDWTLLHSVLSNAVPVTSTDRWYSSNRSTHSAGEGYPIAQPPACRQLANPISLGVNGGAAFEPEFTVNVNELVYDCAKGGGSASNVAFAATGTIRIANVPETQQPVDLPMTFGDGVSGQANVRNWQIIVNGEPSPAKRVLPTAGGFTLAPKGLTVNFR